MSTIRVDPATLRKAADDIARVAEELRAAGNQVHQSTHGAPSYDGQFGSQVAFVGMEALARIRMLADRLAERSAWLAARAEAFEGVDAAALQGLASIRRELLAWVHSQEAGPLDLLFLEDGTGGPPLGDEQEGPARAADVAQWAIRTGRYDLETPTIEKVSARDLAQAMREEYITDAKGRRVRATHPAKARRDGVPIVLWDDIRTAPRGHMEMAFQWRRNHIVGECRLVKADTDSYNESHPGEQPIQMVLDFTRDVEELQGFGAYEELDSVEEDEALEVIEAIV